MTTTRQSFGSGSDVQTSRTKEINSEDLCSFHSRSLITSTHPFIYSPTFHPHSLLSLTQSHRPIQPSIHPYFHTRSPILPSIHQLSISLPILHPRSPIDPSAHLFTQPSTNAPPTTNSKQSLNKAIHSEGLLNVCRNSDFCSTRVCLLTQFTTMEQLLVRSQIDRNAHT